jgi:hypothetical protein
VVGGDNGGRDAVKELAKVVVERGGEKKLGRWMIFCQLCTLISPSSDNEIHIYL